MEATSPPEPVRPTERGRSGDADWLAGTGDGTDPDRHVHMVVLGPPGAGSSTVGRMVAHELHRPYVDHDSVVGLGRDPGGDDGSGADDDGTHDIEVLRRVLATHGSVVYGAGGRVAEQVRPDDVAGAYLVWLDASPEVVVDRLGDREHPVLGPDPLGALRAYMARVDPRLRERADLTVSVDDVEPAVATERIRQAWRRHVDEIESAS